MAVKATIATGNWLTNGTWGTVDATSFANTAETSHTVTTAFSGTRTAAFTPGAIVVSHLGVKLSVRTGTTGTFSIHLALNSTHVEVAGTLVTINTADFPVAATADLNGGWHFFKLATPVTLAAATAYELECTTSSGNQISLFRDSTAGNVSRALITTTSAAPTTGDDVIINGEYTGQGTSNAFTVTYDETATTDYGSTPTAANGLIQPGIAVCNKGTLAVGTNTGTNYNLKLSNALIIYSGGVFTSGDTTNKIPRDSTFTFQTDPGTNVDYGLVCRALGTWKSQGLSRTISKDIYYCKLNTDEAIASTSLGVDTDTGWLDNDVIAVTTTTQTAAQCEAGALNGAASASTLTVDSFAGAGGGLAFAHSGTSPTQAEVVLLTRNVVYRGTSSSLQAYILIDNTAIVDIDWTEFKWLGSNTASKRGMNINTTTGTCDIQYSSFHDFLVTGSRGVDIGSTSGSGITFSNNVMFNIDNAIFINTPTSGIQTITNNFFIKNVASINMVSLGDIGSTFTGNVMCGSGSVGLITSETNGIFGTFSNNTCHGNVGGGYAFQSSLFGGTVTNLTCWRNLSGGINFNSSPTCIANVVFDSPVFFGNNGDSIRIAQGGIVLYNVTFLNMVSNGDTTFSTTNGINIGAAGLSINAKFINCDFSTVSGIKTAHTNDVILSSNALPQIVFINCKLGGANEVATSSNMGENSFVSSQRNDQTNNTHKSWYKYGTIILDTSFYRTASPSERLTPNNASNKLSSGIRQAAVSNGATLTPSVYVRESVTGDGTDYNGARARLWVKRNDAIGITADTLLATATISSEGAFQQLTGTTIAATDAGVMEFYVDCDGTTGWLNVDDWTVS